MQLSPARVRLRCSLARIPCVTSGEGMKSQRAPCKESANIRLKPYIRVDTANTVRAKWAHLGCVLKPDYRMLGSRIDGRGGWDGAGRRAEPKKRPRCRQSATPCLLFRLAGPIDAHREAVHWHRKAGLEVERFLDCPRQNQAEHQSELLQE